MGTSGHGRLRPATHRLHPDRGPAPALAPQTGARHRVQPLPNPARISPTPCPTRFPRQAGEIQPTRTRTTHRVKEPAEGTLPAPPQEHQNGHQPRTATLNRKLSAAGPTGEAVGTDALLNRGLLVESAPGFYDAGTATASDSDLADLRAWNHRQPGLGNGIRVGYQLMPPVLPADLVERIHTAAADYRLHPGLLVMTWALLSAGEHLDSADITAADFYRRGEAQDVMKALIKLGLVHAEPLPAATAAAMGLSEAVTFRAHAPGSISAAALTVLRAWLASLPPVGLAVPAGDGEWTSGPYARPVQALLIAGSILFTDPAKAIITAAQADAFKRAQPVFMGEAAEAAVPEERVVLVTEADEVLAEHPPRRFTQSSYIYATHVVAAWNRHGVLPDAPHVDFDLAVRRVQALLVVHGHDTAQQLAIHLGTPLIGVLPAIPNRTPVTRLEDEKLDEAA
ncbi:MAG: hypothetical protein QOE61_4747, partial [Micromonosporaceae bacterium]|nr:hypothetical protein [Micromonosporaceae bacterium]